MFEEWILGDLSDLDSVGQQIKSKSETIAEASLVKRPLFGGFADHWAVLFRTISSHLWTFEYTRRGIIVRRFATPDYHVAYAMLSGLANFVYWRQFLLKVVFSFFTFLLAFPFDPSIRVQPLAHSQTVM
jgi:hypothetical protein